MSDTKFERYGLLGGVIFVLLTLVPAFATGTPPDVSAPAAEIAEYLSDNAGAIQLAGVLSLIASVFLLFWAGSLWRAMVRAEDGQPRLAVVAALGLVIGGSLAAVTGAIGTTMSFRVDDLGEGVTFFWLMVVILQASTIVGIAAQVGAVSALGIRTRFIPSWLAWGGVAVTVLALLGTIGAGSDEDIWLGLGFLAFILWSVWILCITAVLWKKLEA